MLSCDTFALSAAYFSGNKNCLAKNSDRPLGEAQPLGFFPGGDHAEGEMLRCTYLTIPQVQHTYTVLGSRPHWIWGFEMGVNEMGLMIGNEAEGSRCEAETEQGMLGMDLLRLALERADTAEKGVHVIAELLEKYGQNANANRIGDRRYENSFLLVDRSEIWLMETAGRQWVAKKIRDWAAISNCYTIGGDYDLCSENLEKIARENRWLHPDEPFDFAKAYTAQLIRQERSVPRFRRLKKLISAHPNPLERKDIIAVLRDHFEDELIHPRWGNGTGTFMSICMHAQNPDNSQTAASFICAWDDLLGPVTWHAPSIPCCSVYIPVYWTGRVPEAMKHAEAYYEKDSLWWNAHRLDTLISVDDERYGAAARKSLRALEEKIDQEHQAILEKAHDLMQKNEKEAAFHLLSAFTEEKTAEALSLFAALADDIAADIRKAGGLYGVRKDMLAAYMARVEMPL